MKVKILILVSTITVLIYLLLWPVPIKPRKYDYQKIKPKPIPNTALLKNIEKFVSLPNKGPEDLVLNGHFLYTGLKDGKILKINLQNKLITLITVLPGRPLGLALSNKDTLIVAVVNHGFYKINLDTGSYKRLTQQKFGFEENVVVDKKENYYFTDGSRFNLLKPRQQLYAALEQRLEGKLYYFDCKKNSLTTLLRSINFANGIALSSDGTFLVISDMFNFRLLKYSIANNKVEVFIDHLPGYPDNISTSTTGLMWVAVYSPPIKGLDKIMEFPLVRKIIARLPRFILPRIKLQSWALAITPNGKIVKSYKIKDINITSVVEYKKRLYFGTLNKASIYSSPID